MEVKAWTACIRCCNIWSGDFVNKDEYRASLKIQIREAYGRVVYTYTTHLKQMNRIQSHEREVKNAQIILSAVSTGGLLGVLAYNKTVWKLVAAIVSTLLLALNLILKNSNYSGDAKQHQLASDDLWYVRERYISLLTDFDTMLTEDIIAKRDELMDEVDRIYRNYPKADSKSYKVAQNSLQNKEEQFFNTEEIDKILPENLRIGKKE